MTPLEVALHRHSFRKVEGHWVRGKRYGRRFVATLDSNGTLTVVQTRRRGNGAPQRAGSLPDAPAAELEAIDAFVYGIVRT